MTDIAAPNDNNALNQLRFEVRELRTNQAATVAVIDVLAQIMEIRGVATRAEIAGIIRDSADAALQAGPDPMQAEALAMMRLIAHKISPAPSPRSPRNPWKPPLVVVK